MADVPAGASKRPLMVKLVLGLARNIAFENLIRIAAAVGVEGTTLLARPSVTALASKRCRKRDLLHEPWVVSPAGE